MGITRRTLALVAGIVLALHQPVLAQPVKVFATGVDWASRHVVVGHDGNLWFPGRTQIGRITPAGSVTAYPLPPPSGYSWDITAGPDGNVWYTRPDAKTIGKITPTGTITEYSTIAQAGMEPGYVVEEPFAITAGPDGNLWILGYNKVIGGPNPRLWDTVIGRFSPDAPEESLTTYRATSSERPYTDGAYQIIVGPDGALWFSTGTGLRRSTVSGEITDIHFGAAEGVESIFSGGDGNIWLIRDFDYGGRTVELIRINVATLSPTEFPLPISDRDRTSVIGPGAVVDPNGTAWIAVFMGFPRPQLCRISYTDGLAFDGDAPRSRDCIRPNYLSTGLRSLTFGPDGNLWANLGGEIARVNLGFPPPTPTATPTPVLACVGDCGNDGAVTVDEIIRGVNIALGTVPVGSCDGFDDNGDNAVTVDEIVKAVNAALNGCSA